MVSLDPRPAIATMWMNTVNKESFPGVQFTSPPGDPGMYGPDSAMWYLSGDVSTFVGGVSGLIIGSLHEAIMHGTNQHSSYSVDTLGRLGRTVSFMHAMTYGSMPVVEKATAMVRRMHTRVNGSMPDGRGYDASDSDQLIWVGVTNAHGVVLGHQTYHPRPLSGARVDEYYADWAKITRRLGATGPIPTSRAEVADYFADQRRLLTYSEETADVMRFFRTPYGTTVSGKAGSALLTRAAIDVMPDWAKRLYGIRPNPVRSLAIRKAATALLAVLRASVGEIPMKTEALARIAAAPATTSVSA